VTWDQTHILAMMTRSTSTSIALARAALRFSTVIIAIIIVTTIQNVEAKGGMSIGRSGGLFRSSSSIGSRGGGYRGGFGGGHGYTGGMGLRARWWMIGGLMGKRR